MTLALDLRDKDALMYLCEQHAELIGEDLKIARESLADPHYARTRFENVRTEIGRLLELMRQIEDGVADAP